MSHERPPSDVADLHARLHRALSAQVDDADALWGRIERDIAAEVVVPLRRRPRRRAAALLLAATLAIVGTAFAGLGLSDGADRPQEHVASGDAGVRIGPDDRSGPRARFTAAAPASDDGSDPSARSIEERGDHQGEADHQGEDGDHQGEEGDDQANGSTDDDQGGQDGGNGGGGGGGRNGGDEDGSKGDGSGSGDGGTQE